MNELIQKLKSSNEKAKILIGTGHPKATCQGAAFEYILNVEQELNNHKVRDKVEITWISNEYKLGDFGMDGMLMSVGGKPMPSDELVEMVLPTEASNGFWELEFQKLRMVKPITKIWKEYFSSFI